MKKEILVLLCMGLLVIGAGIFAAATFDTELNSETFEPESLNIIDNEELLLSNGFSAEEIVILGTDVEFIADLIRTHDFTDEELWHFKNGLVKLNNSEELLLSNGFSAEDIAILGTDVEVVATLIRRNNFTDEELWHLRNGWVNSRPEVPDEIGQQPTRGVTYEVIDGLVQRDDGLIVPVPNRVNINAPIE